MRRLPGVIGIHQRRRQRLEVAVGSRKDIGEPRHQGRRRIVGHEVTRELGRNEFRGRWMAREIRQHRLALRHA